MSRVREGLLQYGRFTFGAAVYPYQIAFGISLRYWPCIFAPSIRIHIGPFKLHASIIFHRRNLLPDDAREEASRR